MKDIETVIEGAEAHGKDSDPDHEVGDLQGALRVMWGLLDGNQKAVFLRDPEVRDIMAWKEEVTDSASSPRRRSGTARSKERPSASQGASA